MNDNFIGCSISEHQWNICSKNFKPIGANVLMRRSAYDRGKMPTDQYGTRCQTMIFCDVSMRRSVWGTGFMRRINTALGDNELSDSYVSKTLIIRQKGHLYPAYPALAETLTKAVGTVCGLGGGGILHFHFKRIQFCTLVFLWFPIFTELWDYFSRIDSIH